MVLYPINLSQISNYFLETVSSILEVELQINEANEILFKKSGNKNWKFENT
jgi:hypothetical protein